MPLFSALLALALYEAVVGGRRRGVVLAGLWLGALLNLHPSGAIFVRNHSRASRHTGPHAMRWAPSDVEVRAASSRRSAMTRRAESSTAVTQSSIR